MRWKVDPERSKVDPETFGTTFKDTWTPPEGFPALPEGLPPVTCDS
jgi:hypothetical protein